MPIYNNIWFIGKYLKSGKYLDKLSTDEQRKVLNDFSRYREHLGLGKDATFSAEAFNTYAKASEARVINFELFKANKTLHDKLTSTTLTDEEKLAVKGIGDAIKEVLDPRPKSKPFQDAQIAYNTSVDYFKKLIADIPPQKAANIVDFMIQTKSAAITALEAQQTLEKNAFEAKINTEDFKTYLRTLNIKTPAQIKETQDSMKKELESSQAKELEAFKTSTSESITKLHNAAGAQMRDFLFIASLSKNNPEMHTKIKVLSEENRLAAEKQAETERVAENTKRVERGDQPIRSEAEIDAENTKIKQNNLRLMPGETATPLLLTVKQMKIENERITAENDQRRASGRQGPDLPLHKFYEPALTKISINGSDTSLTLKGISVKELPLIKSLTGKEIHQTSPGTFEVKMDSNLWDWRYYQSPRQNIETDFKLMAQAVRACGYDKITLNCDYDDPEISKERARQAYEAAIEAGFDPKDIVVKIHGKVYGKDKDGVDLLEREIFADQGNQLAKLHDRSKVVQAELKELLKPETSSELVVTAMKEKNLKMVNEAIDKREAEERAAATPEPSAEASAVVRGSRS